MHTIVLTCKLQPNTEENRQILIAALSELDYESFEETATGINAYIPAAHFNPEALKSNALLNMLEATLEYEHQELEDKNWNRIWEENYFKPILIGEQCLIRSHFHERIADVPYEIMIDPKMSFGTGHHETTRLMIAQMLSLDFQGKTVLDMGTGTGVLAILSRMLGAKRVLAVDIEEWAYRNAVENVELNGQDAITVRQGDISLIHYQRFDRILANINLPVLRAHMPQYERVLEKGGQMLLSGFYDTSLPEIQDLLEQNALQFIEKQQLNSWATVHAAKP